MMISIDGLQFGYGRHLLYQGFAARVEQPGIYGLFGRNGSGKSTLLKLVCGLLSPWAGLIEVLGHNPRERAAELLAGIYIVPEEFHLPNLRCAQLAATQGVFYPHFSTALFAEYLAHFEVPEQARFESMSLGQKKKAAIAFALATGTPLLLMDEPTNGLDIVGRTQFRALLQRPEQAHRTVLISTHQAHDLESILSHIWFIDQGQLALSARMDDLARLLHMGVARDEAALALALAGDGSLLYQEPIGQQLAYVALRAPGPQAESAPPRDSVQLELLYKALSLNRDTVLQALASRLGAAAHREHA